MEEALDRALDIGRGLARTDDYVRLLFAELREQRLRDGLANMIDRRLVVDDAHRARAGVGPARPHRRAGVRGRVRAAPWCVHRSDRRRRRISRERTDSPPPLGHLLRATCDRLPAATVPAPGLARGVLDRVESHFLNKDKQPRQRFDGYSAKDCRTRGRVEDSPARRARRGRRGRERAERIPARSECGAVARVRRVYQIALRQYRETLDAHGVLDFSETLASGAVAARADGRVRAQPLPPRGPVSPRAARRIPGHEPRTVDAGSAADSFLGGGQRSRRERSADAVDFSRRRSEAVHLRHFATPTWPSWTRLAPSSTSCAPMATRAVRFHGASARSRSSLRLPTTCSARSKRTSSAAMPSALARMTGFPSSGRYHQVTRSASSRRRASPITQTRSRRRSADCSTRRRSCATPTRASSGR